MKVFRSINNNIVSAFDDSGKEVVVIGRGIGYKAKEGDLIQDDKIEKVFMMRSQNETERLKELFASLPEEYIELTDEILTYAKDTLQKRLHEGAYITLADHISFSITRMKAGQEFKNVLHSEIRRFYPTEYAIGIYALELIRKRLGVVMPEDEAASIALHIFNAEYDISVGDMFHATQLLDEILELITGEIGVVLDESDYYCERFLSHLKFLTQRITRKEYLPEEDDDFYELISGKYRKEANCSENIAKMVLAEEDYQMSLEEISSLTIHLKRIGLSNKKANN